MLAEKDESLAKAARNAPAPTVEERRDSATSSNKKRKSTGDGDENNNGKRRASSGNSNSNTGGGGSGGDLTLSEREARALESLREFIVGKGGTENLVKNYRCRVTKKNSDGRYDTNFYNEQGRRFRSMVEVGRHLNLVDNSTRSAAGLGMAKRKRTSTGGTRKETEAEKKRLRKELDRLRKQYIRATKSLDDFQTDDKDYNYPVEDTLLDEENKKAGSNTKEILPTNCPGARIPDITSFRGLPEHCMPDVLQAWDFLCTFSRAISVQPIPLEDFLNCLTYKPPTKMTDADIWGSPPVYLGEAHLGLMKLILSDPSSDEWWWSILETEQTENAVYVDPTVDAVKEEEESDLPLIKVDFTALLGDPEDPSLTTSWLQELEVIQKIKSTDTVAMKKALDKAMGLVANKWALAYLRKAIQLGKTSGPSFMKRAVAWLVDKVSGAKPELMKRSGTRLSSEETKKRDEIIEEVTKQMEKLSSATLTVVEEDLVSDVEDDEDEDSDEEGQVEEEQKPQQTESSDEDRAASYIPKKPQPSLVDFLLPPGKPIPPTDLLTPASWPYLAGAAACRIVHRYKRLRNEVDDALRRFRDLPHLTVKERREREEISTGRVLSEFVNEDGKEGPTEKAFNVLNSGGKYLQLTPLERLALLRVLIEAAYDTRTVFEVVDSNYKQRTTAMKALDTEQRRAKKEAKEKEAADQAAARLDLAMEAKNNFLEEKREEIRKLNENNQELTMEEIDGLTEQDILDFDEDIKADYDALPTPESFKKAEVVERVSKIQEAAAFETELLTVVTMDELIEREKNELTEMEQDFENLGGEDALLNPMLERSHIRKLEKLRRDIQKAHDATEYLPPMREDAVEVLKEAIADGTIKSLRGAIRNAKTVKLFGPDDETNGVWALDVVRDAHMELENAKHLKRVADARKELISKLNKCFFRTEPLGSDRFRNRFWRFEHSDQMHVWAEVNPVLKHSNPQLENKQGFVDVVYDDISKISVGPPDIEEDFPPFRDGESKEEFQMFSRQEYHSSGATASLVKRHWGCHVNESSVRALMKGLDSRGIREDSLKKNLKEALEEKTAGADSGLEKLEKPKDQVEPEDGNENPEAEESAPQEEFESSGDETALQTVKNNALATPSDLIRSDLLESLKSTAIGQQVRVRIVVESNKEGEIARYEIGTITGWKKSNETVPVETGETEFEPQTKVIKVPFWRVWTENCSEIWLSGTELLESVVRFVKWERKDNDYFEDDSSFLAYRNNLGRYFGKAADAPYAMTPFHFGKYMSDREAEIYQRLKIFAVDNNWGGKSGARNTWVDSMKQFAFDFQTVKEGLLTLEFALFELMGGSTDENAESERTGKALLEDPKTREDIELESIDTNITGLWNSQASRNVFLEIVSSKYLPSVVPSCF